MTVKDIKTGKVMTVNDSYGARLIEQGKATLVRQKKAAPPAKGRKRVADDGTA